MGEKDKKRKREYPVEDLDTPLAKMPSLGLPLDSTSESEAPGHRDKKRRKTHRKHSKKLGLAKDNNRRAFARDLSTRPTPMNKRMTAMVEKQEQVVQAVKKYIADNHDWTASTLREDISEQNGWDNNSE